MRGSGRARSRPICHLFPFTASSHIANVNAICLGRPMKNLCCGGDKNYYYYEPIIQIQQQQQMPLNKFHGLNEHRVDRNAEISLRAHLRIFVKCLWENTCQIGGLWN